MANRLSVQVKSKGGFLAKLPGIRSVVSQAVAATALAVESRAKENAPVDTGRLRSSIASDIQGVTATVGTNVEYAVYIELGTRFQPARPFLYPAAEAERQLFVQRLKAALAGQL
jgi:HK97 gp10 family phage protein